MSEPAQGMPPDPPPAHVLEAFGIAETAAPLAGGQGGAFRAGAYVIKRSESAAEVAWSASVLAALSDRAFRVAPYKPTRDGAWLADGWFAQSFLEGAHATDRWPEVLTACEALHRALAAIERPAFLARRTHPWAVADRMAWGEQTPVYSPMLAELAEPLLARLRPVASPSQVIHGDFSTNLLFAPHRPPAIIDFTPYWRPAAFARAIVVVDAMTWHGASPSLIDAVAGDPEAGQMLLRAELRRLFEADQLTGKEGLMCADLVAHRPVVDRLTQDR